MSTDEDYWTKRFNGVSFFNNASYNLTFLGYFEGIPLSDEVLEGAPKFVLQNSGLDMFSEIPTIGSWRSIFNLFIFEKTGKGFFFADVFVEFPNIFQNRYFAEHQWAASYKILKYF